MVWKKLDVKVMVWKKKGEDVAAQVALIALLILTQVHSAYPHTGVLYSQLLILTEGLAPPSSCSTQPTRLRCTPPHRRIFDLKW